MAPIEALAKPSGEKPEANPLRRRWHFALPRFRMSLPRRHFNQVGVIVMIALIVAAVAIVGVVARSQGRSNAATARVMAGQAALVDGDRDTALYQFTEAIKLDPRIPGAHKALGQIALANGQADEAVRDFETELKINPQDRQSQIELGCLYTLGVVPSDDPHALRGYLLKRFADIAPGEYSVNLAYSPPQGVEPMAAAIVHFQAAAEDNPDDPSPKIGVALAHLASYDLAAARDKLSKLQIELANNNQVDEEQLIVIKNILNDITQEEEYIAALPTEATTIPPQTPAVTSVPPVEINPSGPFSTTSTRPPDLSGSLTTLPPIAGSAGPEVPSPVSPPAHTTFGNRYPAPPSGYQPGDSTNIGIDDVIPQPTVKPITRDVPIEGSNEHVRIVRLVNIYEKGEVGFRSGETVVMPNTNTEVKVVSSSDTKIVLEEHGVQFTWVPGDVGWTLKEPVAPPPTQATDNGSNLDITATKPGEKPKSSGGSSSGGSGGVGPEVPGGHS